MTVRDLICNLVNYDMDEEIIISIVDKEGDYTYSQHVNFVVEYNDGTIGIVGDM